VTCLADEHQVLFITFLFILNSCLFAVRMQVISN